MLKSILKGRYICGAFYVSLQNRLCANKTLTQRSAVTGLFLYYLINPVTLAMRFVGALKLTNSNQQGDALTVQINKHNKAQLS